MSGATLKEEELKNILIQFQCIVFISKYISSVGIVAVNVIRFWSYFENDEYTTKNITFLFTSGS